MCQKQSFNLRFNHKIKTILFILLSASKLKKLVECVRTILPNLKKKKRVSCQRRRKTELIWKPNLQRFLVFLNKKKSDCSKNIDVIKFTFTKIEREKKSSSQQTKSDCLRQKFYERVRTELKKRNKEEWKRTICASRSSPTLRV
jgi:hypothetical protein